MFYRQSREVEQSEVLNQRRAHLQSKLGAIGRVFTKALVQSPILRIWRTVDSQGRLWWHATDSKTGRSLNHVSEAQMRIWLEQRHLD